MRREIKVQQDDGLVEHSDLHHYYSSRRIITQFLQKKKILPSLSSLTINWPQCQLLVHTALTRFYSRFLSVRHSNRLLVKWLNFDFLIWTRFEYF